MMENISATRAVELSLAVAVTDEPSDGPSDDEPSSAGMPARRYAAGMTTRPIGGSTGSRLRGARVSDDSLMERTCAGRVVVHAQGTADEAQIAAKLRT